jgi:hypothetical protein
MPAASTRSIQFSHGRVEILPLRDQKAHELICKAYKEKCPSSFFFITERADRMKARHGFRAALSKNPALPSGKEGDVTSRPGAVIL